jgi:hypothetical protein
LALFQVNLFKQADMTRRATIQRSHRPHGPARRDKQLTVEEVPEHRNITCGLYQICLDVVVRRQWASFSCRPCSLWHRNPQEHVNGEPAKILSMPLGGGR